MHLDNIIIAGVATAATCCAITIDYFKAQREYRKWLASQPDYDGPAHE